MSLIPENLKYVDSHEWLSLEEDGTVTVGITEYAQELLGDIVFVELPEIDSQLSANAEAGVVESVKAASDMYIPIAGKVIAVNEVLEANPELANTAPYTEGWFFSIQPDNVSDLDALLTAAQYAEEIGD